MTTLTTSVGVSKADHMMHSGLLCAPMKIHPGSVWILKSFLREPPKNHHRSRKMAGMDGS